MADNDGIWRYHVMACLSGWKVVESGRTLSVHVRKGAALSAADRASTAQNKRGLRAGVVNHQADGTVREHLRGGPRKPGSGYRTHPDQAGRGSMFGDAQLIDHPTSHWPGDVPQSRFSRIRRPPK